MGKIGTSQGLGGELHLQLSYAVIVISTALCKVLLYLPSALSKACMWFHVTFRTELKSSKRLSSKRVILYIAFKKIIKQLGQKIHNHSTAE